MRIAVIADTHDRCPAELVSRLSGADEIWHLGDVCSPRTLAPIEALGVPLRIVLGNNDWQLDWPETLLREVAGRKWFLIHAPPLRAPAGMHAVLHGHTHYPRDDLIDGVRWLNPGAVTRPARGSSRSFAWLEGHAEGAVDWKLVLLPKPRG